MSLHVSVFLKLCAAKDFGKKLFRDVKYCAREICKIRSEDRFYLKRPDFGKEIDKRVRDLGEKLFF